MRRCVYTKGTFEKLGKKSPNDIPIRLLGATALLLSSFFGGHFHPIHVTFGRHESHQATSLFLSAALWAFALEISVFNIGRQRKLEEYTPEVQKNAPEKLPSQKESSLPTKKKIWGYVKLPGSIWLSLSAIPKFSRRLGLGIESGREIQ